jgi:alpha-mannosidase
MHMSKLYFVDGYHGGIRGHMPEGSWQDILHTLEVYSDWKISLEIEPESWEYLRINDYKTYHKLQTMLEDPVTAKRLEFISGSYAQPFCWAVNGESNIRQLLNGMEVIKRHFPDIVIDTYAVQEPCFTSSLPQILSQLGYARLSLKNPTSWGGYMAKLPGEIINLFSHDGSSIPTVPRYICEELISCSATEASGYDLSSLEGFAEKCNLHGIKAPVGMCLQDLGWAARPFVQDIDVEYVTWREYFERFGSRVAGEAELSQEDVLVALPWGNRILQEMLRNVRNAENRILQAEKLLAIAEAQNVKLDQCHIMLENAWEKLMQAQHHDGYICATCGEGTRLWAFQSNTLATQCCSLISHITDLALEAVSGGQAKEITTEQETWLRVYNTVGNRRISQAEVTLGLDYGIHNMKIYDENNNIIPSQMEPIRFNTDGSIGAAVLRFYATVEGIGYSTYRAVPTDTFVSGVGMAIRTANHTVEISNNYYHVVFDLMKGGSIIRLYDKETKRNYTEGIKGLGSLRGFSVSENRFIDNMNSFAECKIKSNGSIYTELCFSGKFHDIEYQNTVIFRLHDRRIDFETTINFTKDTDIGYPYEPQEEERFHGTKRSSCREDYKMGIQFPFSEKPTKIIKSAPFDLYESKLTDTRFDSWDTIKHNIVNGFIEFYQESSDTGMAIFCDHVNGYSLVDKLVTLTIGFGYHGNFWWGYQPLRGKCTIKYSLLPHASDVGQANVSYEDALVREPLLVQRLSCKPKQNNFTAFCCESKSVETVTIIRSNNKSQVRLFHNNYKSEKLTIKSNIPGFQGLSADLYGRPDGREPNDIRKLEIKTLI